jgi:hypothetical protein
VPELPITGSDGRLHDFADMVLLAVMTYPEDEHKQRQLVASTLVAGLLKTEKPDKAVVKAVTSLPWLVEALWSAPRHEDVVTRFGKDLGLSWPAGELMLTLLGAAIHHPETDITITKAVDAVFRYYHGALTHSGGRARVTTRTIWNAWERFRSVAHFHAARRLYETTGGDSWKANLPEYLAASEEVRREAVTRRFLPSEGLWTSPSSLRLPRVDVEFGALKPEMLAIIRSYKPAHSRD